MKLRPYQQECVDAVWAELFLNPHPLIVMSTGLGKTETVFGLMQKAPPHIKMCFLVNRVTLVEQTYRRASKVFPGIGVYCATVNKKEEAGIVVASVQSIERAPVVPFFNLIIVDEAHRISDQCRRFIHKCREVNPNLKVIGLTATPFKSTGLIYGKDQFFSSVTYSKDLKWAIANGYLVTPRLKRTQEAFDTTGLKIVMGDFDATQLEVLTANDSKAGAQLSDAIPQLVGRKKVAWATANINHARLIHSKLLGVGEKASIIHSQLSSDEQRQAIVDFEQGANRHMVFVTMLSEGYDYPPIDAIVFLRPTRSPVLYVQTIGRGLRNSDGKQDLLILDYAEVVKNCGPLDNPRINKKGERRKKDEADLMKFCPACYEYVEKSVQVCPACGAEWPKVEKDPQKNLTRKSGAGALFSSEIKSEWIDVSDVKLARGKTSKGHDCITVTYFPKDFAQRAVKEWLMMNEPWQVKRTQQRLLSFGVMGTNLSLPNKKPQAIKVKWENGFPKIQEVRFD